MSKLFASICIKASCSVIMFSSIKSQAILIAAALYDAEGRLLGAALQPCADGAAVHNLTIAYAGKPAAGRLFLLKTDSLAPLCEAISLTLPQ
ncbi:MAG: hypothetical protein J6D61_05280, partial [Clostridia bacterium]|nr:hypothetical protein [Clostridia bacterium]